MTTVSLRVLALLLVLGLMGLVPAAHAAAKSTALYVDVRESDSPSAPVLERRKLYGASHALVVGIDDYAEGWPKLNNAVRDARELADELERHGFQVTLKTDPDARTLRETLREFYALRGADPDARLLVWFAGHGHTIDGEGFIVPADAPLPQDPLFKLKALHMRDFGGLMRLAESKHVLSVFDSCFSGTIFTARSGATLSNLTRKTRRPVRQFITSGDAGQQVRDDGSFRKLFVRALRGEERADSNGDGYVTGEELGLYLSQRMTNLTQAAQTPRYGRLQDVNFDEGDFVFALPQTPVGQFVTPAPQGQAAPAAKPSVDQSLFELEFWQSIKGSKDPALFEAFLAEFPNSKFARLAEIKIRSLAPPQPAVVAQAPASSEPKKSAPEKSEPESAAKPPAPKTQTQEALVTAPPPDFKVETLDLEMVALRNANVRALPTTKSDRVATLPRGKSVVVTGRTKVAGKLWYEVDIDKAEPAFVYGTLLGEPEPEPLAAAQAPAKTTTTPPKAAPSAKPAAAQTARLDSGTTRTSDPNEGSWSGTGQGTTALCGQSYPMSVTVTGKVIKGSMTTSRGPVGFSGKVTLDGTFRAHASMRQIPVEFTGTILPSAISGKWTGEKNTGYGSRSCAGRFSLARSDGGTTQPRTARVATASPAAPAATQQAPQQAPQQATSGTRTWTGKGRGASALCGRIYDMTATTKGRSINGQLASGTARISFSGTLDRDNALDSVHGTYKQISIEFTGQVRDTTLTGKWYGERNTGYGARTCNGTFELTLAR